MVSYGEKSKTSKFGFWLIFDVLPQGCEIGNSITMASYCRWIILLNKRTYKGLSKKSKIQNSLISISMKKFENFDLNNQHMNFNQTFTKASGLADFTK